MEFDEVFKVCPFNDTLQVSQYGRIKRTENGEILEQTVDKNHYVVKNPKKEGKEYEWVHRLVALTWLNDTYEKGKSLVTHHIDGNGFNNRVDNLEWINCCIHAGLHGADLLCEECAEIKCEYR